MKQPKYSIFNKETGELIGQVNTLLQMFRERYYLLSKQGIETTTEKAKKPKKIKSIIKSISEIKKDVWHWFSIYIRLRYADENGYVKCVTCGKIAMWNDNMQAGHYVNGRNNAVLFNEDIVYPQCVRCNIMLGGNKNKYTEFMKSLGHSDEQLAIFEDLKNKVVKYTSDILEYLLKDYKRKALEEANKRNITIK